MINDKRKNLVIVTMITIIVIVLGVLGASYAYFQGSIAGNGLSNIKTIANSLDNLVFTPGSDITFTANQSNFGSGSGNRSGSTTSTVKLTARNDASSTHYYRMYLLISENTFVYTYGTTPELTLTVTKNGTTVINAMDVTTTKGVIDIPTVSGGSSLKQPITASAGSTTTDTWVATVTFVNLNSNQNGNAGKGFKAILYIDDSPMLPSEYQEVKYITASGTQYIDPDYTVNVNTKLKTMISTTSASNVVLYGNATALTGGVRCFQTGGKLYSAFGNYRGENTAVIVNNLVYVTEHSTSGLKINGNSYVTSSGTEFEKILFLKDSYSTSYKFIGNVYKLQILENEKVIKDLVPCKRTSGSVAGMYDTVNDVFYTNAGTGNFTAGPNVT